MIFRWPFASFTFSSYPLKRRQVCLLSCLLAFSGQEVSSDAPKRLDHRIYLRFLDTYFSQYVLAVSNSFQVQEAQGQYHHR